jgi:hypothetical protein
MDVGCHMDTCNGVAGNVHCSVLDQAGAIEGKATSSATAAGVQWRIPHAVSTARTILDGTPIISTFSVTNGASC